MLIIGLDTGKNTGIAWAEDSVFEGVKTVKIHHAMQIVENLLIDYVFDSVVILVEDARKRGCRHRSAEKAQGAGSVKRDAVIWQDFLNDLISTKQSVKVKFLPPCPSSTKIDQPNFKRLTGWTKATNEHGRDAGMMVLNEMYVQKLIKRKAK